MSGPLDDIKDVMALTQLLDSGKLDDVYAALATRIGGSGAKDISEAITEIKAAGEAPAMYIPVARSYTRGLREQARVEQDRLDREQARRHADELHQVKLERAQQANQQSAAAIGSQLVTPVKV